jgi:hypothetical protein
MSHKLVWTEGLFVTQHHFQRLDRYHERLLSDRMRLAMAYDWGVIDLAIDERALAAGQLRVSRLTAVMPGGAILTGGGGDAQQLAIPPRPFDSEFTPQMASLDVHIAMAQEVDGMPSVALEPALASVTRYTRSQESLADVNTGTGPQPVDVARPNVRILFGDERRDGFDTIRIAQLTRAASGAVGRAVSVGQLARGRSSEYGRCGQVVGRAGGKLSSGQHADWHFGSHRQRVGVDGLSDARLSRRRSRRRQSRRLSGNSRRCVQYTRRHRDCLAARLQPSVDGSRGIGVHGVSLREMTMSARALPALSRHQAFLRLTKA